NCQGKVEFLDVAGNQSDTRYGEGIKPLRGDPDRVGAWRLAANRVAAFVAGLCLRNFIAMEELDLCMGNDRPAGVDHRAAQDSRLRSGLLTNHQRQKQLRDKHERFWLEGHHRLFANEGAFLLRRYPRPEE